jgi:hypothetical protein
MPIDAIRKLILSMASFGLARKYKISSVRASNCTPSTRTHTACCWAGSALPRSAASARASSRASQTPNSQRWGARAGDSQRPATTSAHPLPISGGAAAAYRYMASQSPTRDEANPTDGKTYLTQWYERERLEFHPELHGTPYEVLLGLLGAEDLRLRGYLP